MYHLTDSSTGVKEIFIIRNRISNILFYGFQSVFQLPDLLQVEGHAPEIVTPPLFVPQTLDAWIPLLPTLFLIH